MKIIKHTFTVSDSMSFDVRIILRDGDPWFIAKDVADVLDYTAASAMVRHLDDDEKGVSIVHTLGGKQEMTIISESGLYTAIIGSRKPDAKTFKRWVTKEVLPSIRKHGAYVTGMEELPERAKAEIADRARYETNMRKSRIGTVCYVREHYNKKEWDNIGVAYAAAEAITRIRGEDYILAFYREFASQLTLHKLEFKKHYEKEAMARFNEAFRIEMDFKESLKKHKSAYSSW